MQEADNTPRFTPRQQEAISMLARGCTWKQTAETVGVHVDTIASWNRKPGFKQAVDAVCQKSIALREKSIEAKMTQLEIKALETLEELMVNAQKDSDRITAARAVLAHQNGRKMEAETGTMVNFLGMTLPGSPRADAMVTGDVTNAND